MMGWSTLPMSPEKTSLRVSSPSVAQTSTDAEPSRCPASAKRSRTPGHRSTSSPYSTVRSCCRAASASATVYRGSTSGRPARLPFWFFHWASLSWMWAESRSMMDMSCPVSRVATISPPKPSFTSRGTRPEWSMWAWVTTT